MYPLKLNDAYLQGLLGRAIRLTDERLGHIIWRHPYLVGSEGLMAEILAAPDDVRKSVIDPDSVALYYRRYTQSFVGDKFMCVVVKLLQNDAFVMSAYMTDRIKL